MSYITIKNIGPIKNVKLDLNKVNVIIGPQGSGKSTIAKIVSYCQWVEKRSILDGTFDDNFTERFMEFHRINDVYFNKTSHIEYVSEAINISYKGATHKSEIVKKKDGISFINSKNIYIPAERNFVSAIPNLGKYKGTNDNIMNFLYDWYEVKKKYTIDKPLPILNLDISFYHTEETDSDTLLLRKQKKELTLNYASSGLQSVLPLITLIDYLTDGLYKEKTSESINEKKELTDVFFKHFLQIIENENRKTALINEMNKEKKMTLSKDEVSKLFKLIAARRNYHYSRFIIEEPEQNLFPETQRDLIYYIIQRINDNKRNHSLLLTTHSPYILYALNNCMLGYLIQSKMPGNEKKELASCNSWIDPNSVSVWEIDKNKGTLRSIIDSNTKTISKHYFNTIMNEVMDEYYSMLSYLEV